MRFAAHPYRIRQESALKGRLRYTVYTSWLYVEMSANGCLFKQALQGCIEKVLGELHFGCYRKISWFKRRSKFQNPNSPRQQIVDWVKAAYENLSSNVTTVRKSFEVCGITTSDLQKVRNNLRVEIFAVG